MKVWKDKKGKDVSGKEFIERWKGGIERVTPIQQLKVSLFGYTIIVAGILFGLVSTYIASLWWLFTILSGSLIVTGVQVLGTYQRFLMLKKLDIGVEND